jgi:hypothetical protein
MPLLTGYAILFLDVIVCEFVKSHAYLYIQLCGWGIVLKCAKFLLVKLVQLRSVNSLQSLPRDREKLSKDRDG